MSSLPSQNIQNCLACFRDADETISWIAEKDTVLSSDDYGRDLASVNALLRKHEALERDLAALEDKVIVLGAESDRLQECHPDSSENIASKQEELVTAWESLRKKVYLNKAFILLQVLPPKVFEFVTLG